MTHQSNSASNPLPAPCIVDTGLIVHKRDMLRLLADLGRVHYIYEQDGAVISEGEGYVVEVFSDAVQSTLVVNNTLYLNVQSFDYLELQRSPQHSAVFDLIQSDWHLRLYPLSNPLQDQTARNLNAAALEAVVAEVLSAGWDMRMDDDDSLSL
jgi:hypothetical protein